MPQQAQKWHGETTVNDPNGDPDTDAAYLASPYNDFTVVWRTSSGGTDKILYREYNGLGGAGEPGITIASGPSLHHPAITQFPNLGPPGSGPFFIADQHVFIAWNDGTDIKYTTTPYNPSSTTLNTQTVGNQDNVALA